MVAIAELTDRQRLVCLLVSIGLTQKRIANLLDIGVRTVEHEKQLAANLVNLPTKQLVIWTVENRKQLRAAIKDWSNVPIAVRDLIAARI